MLGSNVLSSQKTTVACWPTPTGFGEASMYAKVGISHEGVCADVEGISIVEVVIEVAKSIINDKVDILVLENRIFHFSP